MSTSAIKLSPETSSALGVAAVVMFGIVLYQAYTGPQQPKRLVSHYHSPGLTGFEGKSLQLFTQSDMGDPAMDVRGRGYYGPASFGPW